MKKAVSTPVIIVLVLLILVSLILMSYQWLLTYSPKTQWEIEQTLGKKEGCLKIENIDTINKKIVIRNCGKTDLSNFIVYLDEEPLIHYSEKLESGEIEQISYTKYIPSGNHDIQVSSDYAESPKIIFFKDCDVYIYQAMIPYTIDQSNAYYCLAENIQVSNDNATTFLSGIQNSTLDCRNYKIDSISNSDCGIYLYGSNTKNNVIKNCVITDFDKGIYLSNGPNNNIITNNNFTDNKWGIQLHTSSFNRITNNIANTTPESPWSYDFGNIRGFELWQNADNNIVTDNIAFNASVGFNVATFSENNVVSNNIADYNGDIGFRITSNSVNNTFINNKARYNYESYSKGFMIEWSSNENILIDNEIIGNNRNVFIRESSNYNNITGGSLRNGITSDYYLVYNAGPNNLFRNTDFTNQRRIELPSSSYWFNYNDRTDIELWLKTRVSSSATLTRKLVNWYQDLIQWNDTSSSTRIVTYNIIGLTPDTDYTIYNNSVLAYTINSGSNGEISFTIDLPQSEEHEIKVNITTAAPPDNVLWISFNEGIGTNVFDSSTYNNDGLFYGEIFSDGILGSTTGSDFNDPSRVNGLHGEALDFDGVNDVVRVPDSNNLDLNETFTIAAWIYPEDWGGDNMGRIVHKYTSSGGYIFYVINLTSDGQESLKFWSKNMNLEATYYSIDLNKWQYVAVTYNRTHLVFFVNNSETSVLERGVYLRTNRHLDYSGSDLYIGNNGVGGDREFNGIIDELRIWNRSLNRTEIQAEMQNSLPVIRPSAVWSFEESGDYANDTHIWIKGNKSSGLSFDGINDYVDCGNDASLRTYDITISFWINLGTNNAQYDRILQKGASDDYGYAVRLWSNNRISFAWYNNDYSNMIHRFTSSSLTEGQWTHIATTFDGTNSKIYFNGIEQSTSPSTETPSFSGSNLNIGRRAGSTYNHINASIDEVRIWNRALTQAEIQADMNNP
jgi:parallel beta-helix repeat protein